MVRPRLAAIAFAGLLLAGCTPLAWVKPGASSEQAEQDLADCQQQAWREATFRSWMYGPPGPAVVWDAYGRPYYVWPYSPFSGPFNDRFLEESRLSRFCMHAKGYDLVPVPKEGQPR